MAAAENCFCYRYGQEYERFPEWQVMPDIEKGEQVVDTAAQLIDFQDFWTCVLTTWAEIPENQ